MISIVVVVGKNREIGFRNKLLWDLPEDMERFQKTTTGHTVIMGDKTFESIGRPLPNRKNVVVSLDENYQAEGAEVRNSLEDVLKEAKESDEEVFVIGGGIIFELAMSWVDKLYITVVDDAPEADTFFPDYSDFKNVVSKKESSQSDLKYTFYELTR